MSTNLSLHFDENQLNRIARQVDTGIRRAIAEGVKKTVDDTVANAKLGGFKDQGLPGSEHLRVSIYGQLDGWSGDWFWGLVHSPASYTSYVELGTAPHKIYPKAAHGTFGPLPKGQSQRATGKGPHEHIVGRGQALRWVDGSGEHFARVVDHPGSVGFHFMKYAETVARREIAQLIQSSIHTI